jgi:hypothetical protein
MPQLNPSNFNEPHINITPMQAYTALAISFNLSLILLHFPLIAPFASVIGFAAGCGSIAVRSNGFH